MEKQIMKKASGEVIKVMIKRVGDNIKYIRKFREDDYNSEIEKNKSYEDFFIRAYNKPISDKHRTTIEVAYIPKEELIHVKRKWTGNAFCMASGGMTNVELEKGYEESEKTNF